MTDEQARELHETAATIELSEALEAERAAREMHLVRAWVRAFNVALDERNGRGR